MEIMSFDAKNYERQQIIQLDNIEKNDDFFTPLGAGVLFKNHKDFPLNYYQAINKLAEEFRIPIRASFYSSTFLKKEIGTDQAYGFCEKLLLKMQNFIKLIHVSYVYLPLSSEKPDVCVGGYRCPEISLKKIEFLRKLPPMFSYITAWNFLRRHNEKELEFLIDNFRSKYTIAWDELITYKTPKLFARGDECNPYISISDIIAFLTDHKLYLGKLKLTEENVRYIWKDYSFGIDCKCLDESSLSKIKWYNDQLIDTREYLAHPIVFILIDQIEKYDLSYKLTNKVNNPEEKNITVKKVREVIQETEPYFYALKYAHQLGGSVQFFDKNSDSDKVRDGDVFVYMGEVSRRIAETFNDGFFIEVIKLRDLRQKLSK